MSPDLPVIVADSAESVPVPVENSRPETPAKDRKLKSIVKIDPNHLTALVTFYNPHFSEYSKGRSKTTQLISGAVWKKVICI